MRILVTGATGFVGGHVAHACLEAGHEVRALVRPTTPADHLRARGVEVVAGDVTDPESCWRAARKVDAVMHLAALLSFREGDEDAFHRANVEGARNVVRAGAEAGARIVYCSSVVAVGAASDPEEPVDEQTPWNLAGSGDPYISSKRAAEDAILDLAATGRADVVVVNPTTPVGPGDVKPTPMGELLTWLVNGTSRLWVDGGMNVVDVRDVASAHLLALEHGRTGERYILGAEDLTSKELFQRFSRLTGAPKPIGRAPKGLILASARAMEAGARLLKRTPPLNVPTAQASFRYYFASSAKATAELGYAPGPVDSALRDAARWFCERGYTKGRAARRVLRHLRETAG